MSYWVIAGRTGSYLAEVSQPRVWSGEPSNAYRFDTYEEAEVFMEGEFTEEELEDEDFDLHVQEVD